jgi:hypothetical protein
VTPIFDPNPLESPAISEGRAYHRGDVVLLRSKVRLPDPAWERWTEYCKRITEETGVRFVVLDANIEVVEPKPE